MEGEAAGAAAGAAPILATEGLAVRFGGLRALNNVNLAVAPGEIRAIIGPNGAGKSTLFNCLTGVLRPTAGHVRIAAQSRRHSWSMLSHHRAYRDIIDKAEAALEQVGLGDKGETLAANLSHGEQRNLEIGIALATEPQLLCLDEPTAGMSAAETHETMELVRRVAQNLTILIVEHDMQVVMELADRITVLDYGEILAEGTPAEIQQNPRVLEVYLKT